MEGLWFKRSLKMGFQAACVSGMNAPTYILKILVRGAHLMGC
ncbi:hypothetical protein [Kingella negevensis]|nr:hypothetical protein [Kingella negevensis]MDK4679692.1 hypothetical protein [Kingella negevensis]MDK4682589.1 hypothetical protein [Kingella negevensis]MDK4690786.1 hypothetical protein [Kingella negevensis]MDK4694066.1 hypothetical protein [Kingella negevensis]MDK4699795.1 hypothetical protein [Kingella negevensis]